MLPAILAGAACSVAVPNYWLDDDANAALKTLGASGIALGSFTGPRELPNCRGATTLALPGDVTPAEYLRKAFEEELKAAGAYGAANPRVVLSGNVDKLEFSSSNDSTADTSSPSSVVRPPGFWDLGLTLSSSNGRKLSVSERYQFRSHFMGDTGCKYTAAAYMRTVQSVIRRAVRSPEFRPLVQ